MLEIFIINALSDNYIYLLRNEHKNITSVIDPGEAEPVINFLNNKKWNLDEVINTHHHHDHIGGNRELLDIYKSKLIAPSYEKTVFQILIFLFQIMKLSILQVYLQKYFIHPVIH